MKKNRKIVIIMFILAMIFTFLGGTLAYFAWQNTEAQKTRITLSMSSDFSCSADGGGHITENDLLLVPTEVNENTTDKYVKRKVLVNPTITDDKKNIYMDLWLNINDIGSGLSSSVNFMYALTTGDKDNNDGVVISGNFNGVKNDDKIKLLDAREYATTTEETYYLWIWLDSNETSSSTMNQKFDFSLGGICEVKIETATVKELQIDSVESSYQMITANVLTTEDQSITSYAVTSTEDEPELWESVSDNFSSYTLNYLVNQVGKYYVWFKDSSGKVISKSVDVAKIDNVSPVCSFGNFSKDTVANGENVSIEINCEDSGVGISPGAFDMNALELIGTGLKLPSDIIEQKTVNGYKYILNMVGDSITTSSSVSVILNASGVKDKAGNGNEKITSSSITTSTNDSVIPVVSINPSSSNSYELVETITVTLTDDEGISPYQSIKYRFQNEKVCSTKESDYALSAELDNKVLTSKEAKATIYTIGNSVLGISTLNGEYYLCVYGNIRDSSGNVSETTRSEGTYLFDTKSPTLSVNVSDGTTYSKEKEVIFTVEDSGPSYLKGGSYSIKYAWSTSTLRCNDISTDNIVNLDIKDGESKVSASAIVSGYTGSGKLYACPNGRISDNSGNTVASSVVSADMYLDNEVANGTVNINASYDSIGVSVSMENDHSKIKSYGYLLQKDNDQCPINGYVSSSNNNYTFNGSYSSGTYYVCVKVIDNLDNSRIISGVATLSDRNIAVNGAVNETITIQNAETNSAMGTITTDSSGKGTVSLDNGNYLFISNVAKSTTDINSDYSKNINIIDTTDEINFYPDGALYWYGNGDNSSESLYSKSGGIGSNTYYRSGDSVKNAYDNNIVNNSNNFVINAKSTSSIVLREHGRLYYFNNLINKNSYTDVKSRYSLSIGSGIYTYSSSFNLVGSLANNWTALGSFSIGDNAVSMGDANISIGNNNSFYYNIYMHGKGSTSNFNQSLTLYAIWLE